MNTQLQTAQKDGFVNLNSLDDAFQFANMLAQSAMVPKMYAGKPADIVIAMQMGFELGLKPLQSLQNIAVVNGRPTVWGDAVVAICQKSGLLDDITEVVTDTEASVTVTRTGQAPHTVTFSMDDAKKAGLAGKAGPWTQYPKRMMKNRARAFALRDKFADVLSGLGITEEEKDRVLDVTPRHATPKATNAGVSALLNRVKKQPTAEAPVIEYYDVSCILTAIDAMTHHEQIKSTGQEFAKMLNDDSINIKESDIDAVRQALMTKKSEIETVVA